MSRKDAATFILYCLTLCLTGTLIIYHARSQNDLYYVRNNW